MKPAVIVATLLCVIAAFSVSVIQAQELNNDFLQHLESDIAGRTLENAVDNTQVEPEQMNYQSIGAEQFKICHIEKGQLCCCIKVWKWKRCWCTPKFGKRSVDDPIEAQAVTIYGSEKELGLYKTPEELQQLGDTRVVRAGLYSRPLSADVTDEVSRALGGKQYAVLITLDDGRKFLAVKGNQQGEGRETVLILANHVTDDWVKVESKPIAEAKVIDYIRAGGGAYDLWQDNGTHAAIRMMKLD